MSLKGAESTPRVIDFSRDADLGKVVGSDYDEVAEKVRQPYGQMMDELGRHFRHSLCWWLEMPSARNQRFTRIFHDCVVLALLQEYFDSERLPAVVIVDSTAAQKLLVLWSRSIGAALDVRISGAWPRRNIASLRDRLSPVRVLAMVAWTLFVGRLVRPGVTLEKGRQYTLVDTFLLPGHENSDRYYPGFTDMIETGADSRCLQVPELVGYGALEVISLFRRFRTSDTPVLLFKEAQLGFLDWIACLRHWRARTRIQVPRIEFLQQDFSPLIRSEMVSGAGFRPACQGLLNYRFSGVLAKRQLDIKRVIDWWENQPLDKGWNLGFRKYFPNVDCVGYNGMHGGYLAIRPLDSEYAAGVLPKRIAVMGGAYINDREEFSDLPKWEVAPAFRHQWLWSDIAKSGPGTDKNTVLVSLTIDRTNSRGLLEAVNHAAAAMPDVKFRLKAHPMMPLNQIVDSDLELEPNCFETRDSIATGLSDSRVLVCSGHTTVSLEGLAHGNDVILFGRYGRGVDAPHVRGVGGFTFTVSHNGPELADAIRARITGTGVVDDPGRDTELFFARNDRDATLAWFLGSEDSTYSDDSHR